MASLPVAHCHLRPQPLCPRGELALESQFIPVRHTPSDLILQFERQPQLQFPRGLPKPGFCYGVSMPKLETVGGAEARFSSLRGSDSKLPSLSMARFGLRLKHTS